MRLRRSGVAASDPAPGQPLFRLGAFVAVLAVSAIGMLFVIETERRQSLDALSRFARDQADWSAYQLEADRFRLEIALSNAQSGDPALLTEAAQRYAIFAARLPALRQGDARSLLRSMPAYSVALTKVDQFLQRYDASFDDGLTQGELGPMLKSISELRIPLTVLSNATVHARTLHELTAKEGVVFYDRAALAVLVGLLLAIAGFALYALMTLRRTLILERHLRESRERLGDFARIASDWYWETDENHRFSYVSRPAHDQRFKPGVLIGSSVLDLARRLAQNHTVAAVLAGRVDQRAPFHDLRLQATAQDGSLRHMSISGAPIFSSDSRFLGYRGNARDVTTEIEADMALNAALRAAQSASMAKSAFLANMSHELRTPLNAVIGFSEMLRMVAADRLAPNEVGYLADIQASGRHLLGLINGILELAKAEAGRLDLSSESTAIAQIVLEAARMLEPMSRQNRVAIVHDANLEALPPIHGDRMRLRQVFLNLISNAVKYTAEGGAVRLEGCLEESQFVRVVIVDEGIGMRQEDVALALRPFERLSSVFTQSREGAGLGLPIADSLIRAHGGTLSIETALGRGTRVSVRLPMAKPADPFAREPVAIAESSPRLAGAADLAN